MTNNETECSLLPWPTDLREEVFRRVLPARYRHQSVCAVTPEMGREDEAKCKQTHAYIQRDTIRQTDTISGRRLLLSVVNSTCVVARTHNNSDEKSFAVAGWWAMNNILSY